MSELTLDKIYKKGSGGKAGKDMKSAVESGDIRVKILY